MVIVSTFGLSMCPLELVISVRGWPERSLEIRMARAGRNPARTYYIENGSIDRHTMKPALPPPQRPDGTPFTTLDSLFRAVIAVPKTEIDKREKEWKRSQKKKRTKKPS